MPPHEFLRSHSESFSEHPETNRNPALHALCPMNQMLLEPDLIPLFSEHLFSNIAHALLSISLIMALRKYSNSDLLSFLKGICE